MAAGASDGFRHSVLFYTDIDQYQASVARFTQAALAGGEVVLVTVPGPRAAPLREALGDDWQRVMFRDIRDYGGNPGRLIPAIHGLLNEHPGRRVSFVGEPAWPERRGPEFVELARHEALSNLAFAGAPLTAMCPYDASTLPAEMLTAARQTHPLTAGPDGTAASPAYLGPVAMPAHCREPLPDPPASARTVRYEADLRPVRTLAGRLADAAGLSADRAGDLVVAVGELAANTLVHTPGPGRAWVWQADGEVVCEVRDQGWIADPLADRPDPRRDPLRGHGLWVVHQVCDLVEVRTGPGGTTVRVHMYLDRP